MSAGVAFIVCAALAAIAICAYDIAVAVQRIAAAQEPDETQSDLMRQLVANQELALKQRQAWEAEQREHMAVCARRYGQIRAGERRGDEPATH